MQLSNIRLFVVIGRTGHSLIVSKVLPFSALGEINEIFIFSEIEGFVIPKSRYITIPGWIRRIRPSIIRNIVRFIFEPLQLLYYTLKLKPDIINGIYCLPKGLNSLIVAKITGTKCVNSVIGSRLEIETELPFRKLWEKINIMQLHRCNVIAIKGKADVEFLTSKKVNPSKMFRLNGAIDTEKFFFTNDVRPVDLLFVGTFYELKGPDRFVKIIEQLLPDYPALKAVMVGTGRMWEETKEMVVNLKLDNNVSFEGYQKTTVPYFQQSKILLMPSRSESLPTAMLEAMSCGCVPIISDVGNVKEAAYHNINSKVVGSYLDIDSYVNCIIDLLENLGERTELANKGRQLVEENYSILEQSKIAKKIINYLNFS